MNLRHISGGKYISAFLAVLLIGMAPIPAFAQSLQEQKKEAAQLALKQPSVNDEGRATQIGETLGDAFGTQEDMDALLAKVTEMCSQSPSEADAIAAAATAFVPTPEFAERVARAAAAGAPDAAGAIAAALKSAVPSANLASLQRAAKDGANIATSGTGGGSAPGNIYLPTAGGGGGGGGGGQANPPQTGGGPIYSN